MSVGGRMPRANWLAVLLPFTLLALLRIPEGPRFDAEDYAHYLLHAEAIAEGRPYTDIGFISTPLNPYIGPVAMPPGLPVLLAPIVALDSVRSPLIPYFMLGWSVGFLALATAYFRRREPLWLALAVGALSGLQPSVLHVSTQVHSDLPFCAMIWTVILLTERESEPWSAARVLGITLAGVAAISTRLAGISLIPAVAAFGILHFRVQGIRPLVPLLCWIATFKVTSAILPTTSAMIGEVVFDPMSLWHLDLYALRTYTFGLLDAQLYPVANADVNRLWHVLTVGLLLVGALSAVRAYWRSFLGIFVFGYSCMLLLLPVSDARYFYPLIPVIVLLTLRGAVVVLERLRPKWSPGHALRVTVMAAAVVALMATVTAWTPPVPNGITTQADVTELYAALRALPARPSPRVMAVRPRILVLETGVRAMALVRGAPDIIVRELCANAITHVVVGDLQTLLPETGHLRRALSVYRGSFAEVYRNRSFSVWRFDPAAADAALDGPPCAPRATSITRGTSIRAAAHVKDLGGRSP